MKWKKHITKSSWQTTLQKHINNLITTFTTALICRQNILQKKLEIADWVECVARKPAYIAINDHKENFSINLKCCLINPVKSELGKVAKITVENINKTVREKLHATSGEIHQMLSIGSKILPTNGIVYLLNLILKSFTLQ